MTNRWPLSVSRGANERNIGSVQAPPSRKSLVWGTLFVGFHKNSNHTLEAGALVYSAPGFVKVVRGETKRKADQKSSYDIHTLEVLFLYSSRKKQQRVNAHTEIIVTYCTRLRQLTVVQESTTKRPFARDKTREKMQKEKNRITLEHPKSSPACRNCRKALLFHTRRSLWDMRTRASATWKWPRFSRSGYKVEDA